MIQTMFWYGKTSCRRQWRPCGPPIGRWKIGKIGMTGKTGCNAPLLILRRAVTGVLPGRTVFIEEALLQASGFVI